MDDKKKIVTICIGIAVITVLGVGTTLAYLSANTQKENKITVGQDRAEISELFSEPSVQTMDNVNVKKVTVVNTGNVPCFVRVYAEFSDSKVGDIASVTNDGVNFYNWVTQFKEDLAQTTNSISEDWQYVKDTGKLGGYFYYKKILPVGAETSSLFEIVRVNYPQATPETNIDQIQNYEMVVYSETVQATETDGTEYQDGEWKAAWESFLKVSP